MEISREGRAKASTEDLGSHSDSAVWEKEDFDVPLVLMTLGWDPSGDPTKINTDGYRDPSCIMRVLDLPRVKTWFTSHTQRSSRPHPNVSVIIASYQTILHTLDRRRAANALSRALNMLSG